MYIFKKHQVNNLKNLSDDLRFSNSSMSCFAEVTNDELRWPGNDQVFILLLDQRLQCSCPITRPSRVSNFNRNKVSFLHKFRLECYVYFKGQPKIYHIGVQVKYHKR